MTEPDRVKEGVATAQRDQELAQLDDLAMVLARFMLKLRDCGMDEYDSLELTRDYFSLLAERNDD